MKILQPLFYALLICAGIIIGSLTKSTNSDTEKSDKLNAILQLINLHYVDTINSINFEYNVLLYNDVLFQKHKMHLFL